MKIFQQRCCPALFLPLFIFFFHCTSSGSNEVTGPILDISEAESLVVDQFFVNGGLDDEFSSQGEFAIYLRDAATGQDIACVGGAEGLKQLGSAGTYYGELDLRFREVSATHPEAAARFQIVVVEKDSDDCPSKIDADDDIVGTSAELTFESLLSKMIWTTNGLAAVTLRAATSDALSIPSMEPSLTTTFAIDKLFFTDDADDSKPSRYFIFFERIENIASVETCQIADAHLTNIQYDRLLYAALGIPIDCFSPSSDGFSNTVVKASLWIQKENGPQLIGETEAKKIGELIGEKASFTNGNGYFKFQSIITKPFSTAVVRLAELTSLKVTKLSYTATPSFNPTVELHIFPGSDPYSVACAGEDQGLSNVSAPGTREGLSATLAAVTGQKALFGWSDVTAKLVNRKDGKKCPAPLASAPEELAKTSALTPSTLGQGELGFLTGGGSVVLSQ